MNFNSFPPVPPKCPPVEFPAMNGQHLITRDIASNNQGVLAIKYLMPVKVDINVEYENGATFQGSLSKKGLPKHGTLSYGQVSWSGRFNDEGRLVEGTVANEKTRAVWQVVFNDARRQEPGNGPDDRMDIENV